MRVLARIALLCLVTSLASAQIVYVDQDNASGVEDGLSWATAFSTVQPGVDAAASASGEIWMAEGVYDEARDTTGTLGGENLGSVLVMDGLELYGGFTGSETMRAERNPFLNITTIDGATSRGGLPAHHVIHLPNGSFTFLLDGVHVQGGEANLGPGGGGIYAHIANPGTRIRNSYFENNEVIGLGIGGALNAPGAEVRNTIFRSNIAQFGGSAINVFGYGLFQDCVFQDNVVLELDEGFGGGTIISVGSSAIIDDCKFVGNQAPFGAAIASIGSIDSIFRSSFIDNHTTGQGGAIGFDSPPSYSYVVSSEFIGNTAEANGGGVAIIGHQPVADVFGSSFAHNSANNGGGSVYYSDDAWPTLGNLAIGTSSAPAVDGITLNPEPVTESVLPGGFPGTGNIDADPQFTDIENGNLYLAETSPGINAADAVFDDALLQIAAGFIDRASASFDIFGAPRPYGGGVDMGAYEFIGDVGLCSTIPMIESELDALLTAAGVDEVESADGLPGHASIALLKYINCTEPDFDPVAADTYQEAYHRNLAQLLSEPDAGAIEPYRHALAALLLISQSTQDATADVLSLLTIQLEGDFHIAFNDPSYGPRASRASYLETLSLGELAEVSGDGHLRIGGQSNAEIWTEFTAAGGMDADDYAREVMVIVDSTNTDSDSNCAIEALLIGTPMESDLDRLRAIRDEVLLPLPFGWVVVEAYYAASPALIYLSNIFPVLAWAMRCAIWLLLHPSATMALLLALGAALTYRKRREALIPLHVE